MQKPDFAFWLLIVLTSWLASGEAQTRCAHTAGMFVGSPSGMINGVNTAFALRTPPSDGCSVRLFLNGSELLPAKDFNISGRQITILRAPLQQGDVLSASYLPAAALALNEDNNNSVTSLVRSILLDAIKHEEAPRVLSRSATATLVATRSKIDTPERLLPERRSSRLLRERLEQNGPALRESTFSAAYLNGIDGLGDGELPSSYNTLLGVTKNRQYGVSAANSTTLPKSTSARSLEMLGRRLTELKEQDRNFYSESGQR